jgi:hypothetical protein
MCRLFEIFVSDCFPYRLFCHFLLPYTLGLVLCLHFPLPSSETLKFVQQTVLIAQSQNSRMTFFPIDYDEHRLIGLSGNKPNTKERRPPGIAGCRLPTCCQPGQCGVPGRRQAATSLHGPHHCHRFGRGSAWRYQRLVGNMQSFNTLQRQGSPAQHSTRLLCSILTGTLPAFGLLSFPPSCFLVSLYGPLLNNHVGVRRDSR